MITLDDNATAIEPTASHRYQYTRQAAAHPAAAAPGGAQAVGAAPGQHVDSNEGPAPGGSAAPRTGGYGTQNAIGGLTRAAIPGLGGAGGGYQPAAIPGLTSGMPSAPPGVPQPAAAAAALAAPGMRRELRSQQGQQGQQGADFGVEPVFPSEWRPGLPVKLPGQTRVRNRA